MSISVLMVGSQGKFYPRGRQHAPWADESQNNGSVHMHFESDSLIEDDFHGLVSEDGHSLQARTVYQPKRTAVSVHMNPTLAEDLEKKRRGNLVPVPHRC